MFAHRFEQLENFICMVANKQNLNFAWQFFWDVQQHDRVPADSPNRTCQQQLQLPRHHVSRDPQVGIQVSELP
jgi:hypothetical protein